MRLTKEQLDEVKKKYGVKRLFSWSMINTFMTSPFEYYLKYVIHTKEDRQDCSYATLGSICHSVLEDYYSDKIKYANMIDVFEDGWLTAIDIADLKFDRNDLSRNASVGTRYKENLIHFFENHKVIKHCNDGSSSADVSDILHYKNGQLGLEQFITIEIGGHIFQGYIDVLYKDYDGIYNIIDWKTSTQYKGKKAEEEAGQLVIYAIGLHQLGIPWDKIRIGWNFLKYITIQYQQANGTTKLRDVERCKIGESLQANAKMWLKKLGYANQVDDYLKELLDTNDITVLPEDVQRQYIISDCYTYVNITDSLLDNWIHTILTNIQDIEWREQEYKISKNNKLFWDTEESIKKESYYFATLCGYSPSLHLPYREYLERIEAASSGADTFSGIGSDINETSNTENKTVSPSDDVDLDWLNQL